jgi:hypothetical protein
MPMVSLTRTEEEQPLAPGEGGTLSPGTNPALDTEALFAVIGLARVLAGRPTLHKYQWQKAADMPKDIRRRILRFIASDSFSPGNDVPDFDYGETLRHVTQEGHQLTPEQAQALLAVLPDQDMALDLGVQAGRILTWADGIMPRDTEPSVLGARPADPDAHATADFRRVWQVALDPMHVLDELEDGSLADDQVQTLALLYPQIYAEIRQAITDQVAAMEARHKGWEPSPQKAAMIQMLRQESQIDPDLAATVQQVYAVQPDAQPAPSGARRRARGKTGGDAGEGLTPGAKAAAGG